MPGSADSIRYHLAQLAELCRDHPFQEKIVFVPSRQIGHNLGTALALEGVSWVNLHLTTPADWARRLAGPQLRSGGWRPLVQDADFFFVQEAVRRMDWPNGHPFGRGVSVARLARTLLKTVRALRVAEIEPHELSSADDVLSDRRIFIDLYSNYCRWLDEERLYDEARLFQEARKVPQDAGIVAVLDETPLSEAAFRFVQSLSDSAFRIGRPVYGIPSPQHSAFERLLQTPYWQGEESVGPGGRLHTSGLGTATREDVRLREAIGAENEVRGLFREYWRGDIRLDQIELAYTSEIPYLPLIVELVERLDVPATFAAGVPVTFTLPGQALIGFFRWIAEGFDPNELVRLLRTRLLFLDQDRDAPRFEAPELAQLILEARVSPGRTSWIAALERVRARLRSGTSWGSDGQGRMQSRRLALIRKTELVLTHLYSLVPPSDEASLRDVARAGISFLSLLSRKKTQRDQTAAESLVDRLGDLADGGSAHGPLTELAASLVDLMIEHKIEAAVARAGSLYVVPLERAGYSGRMETAIVGLSEATFPGVALEDPILLDDERARVSGRLVLQRARASEPVWHLVRVLGMAAGRVTLTAARRDLMEGRETFPAAIFEQLKHEIEAPTPPVYGIIPRPELALTGDECALALRGSASVLRDFLHERPWLEAGLKAVRSRAAASLSIYDGWLGRATPELRPGTAKAISTSRLEELAACPYRYFLRNVLKIRPPDVTDDVPGHWLTPLEFGSLLHEVLKTFMERVSARQETVSARRHADEIEDLLRETVAIHRDRNPVQHSAGYVVDLKRLERAVQIFLTEESRRAVKPVGFEVSFGMGKSDGLAVPDPVHLKLGDGVEIMLRGTIDRIDQADDGYEVWDYKSGSTYDFDDADMLSGGRRLQWALYAYVLDELLERAGIHDRTRRSGYFFTSDREHGVRLSEPPPLRDVLGSRLAPLFELVERGAFLHVQKNKACTFCDYHSICAAERRGKKELDEIFEEDAVRPFDDALTAWMEV